MSLFLIGNVTFFNISLSNSQIKNRQMTIIKIFKNLQTEKIINNSIFICFKNVSKKTSCIEVKDLRRKILVKISQILFTENFK